METTCLTYSFIAKELTCAIKAFLCWDVLALCKAGPGLCLRGNYFSEIKNGFHQETIYSTHSTCDIPNMAAKCYKMLQNATNIFVCLVYFGLLSISRSFFRIFTRGSASMSSRSGPGATRLSPWPQRSFLV